MLDFKFISPTQFVVGRNAEASLVSEASKLGDKILLHYGGGSIKKSGLPIRLFPWFVRVLTSAAARVSLESWR